MFCGGWREPPPFLFPYYLATLYMLVIEEEIYTYEELVKYIDRAERIYNNVNQRYFIDYSLTMHEGDPTRAAYIFYKVRVEVYDRKK